MRYLQISKDNCFAVAAACLLLLFECACKLNQFSSIFAPGEMAERSIAAVLKTVDCNRSGGSNPSLSAFARRSCKAQAGSFISHKILFLF